MTPDFFLIMRSTDYYSGDRTIIQLFAVIAKPMKRFGMALLTAQTIALSCAYGI